MRTRLFHGRRPDALAIVLLAALVFRAYIPIGYMPASGAPFLVELCPAYAAAISAPDFHHRHSQGHAAFQNCPFGSALAQGPISHLLVLDPPGRITSFVDIPAEQKQLGAQSRRTQQARGPPSPA